MPENEPENIFLKLEGQEAERFREFKKREFLTANAVAARKIILERLAELESGKANQASTPA